MERIKRNEVEYYTDLCNEYLKEQNKITITRRYGYYAIDYKNGNTLRTGLTLKECYDIVYCLYTMLDNENYINNCIKEQLESEAE